MEYTIAGIPNQPIDSAHYIDYQGIQLAVIAIVSRAYLAESVLLTAIENGWTHVVVLEETNEVVEA